MPVPVDQTVIFNISASIVVSYSGASGDYEKMYEVTATKGLKMVNSVSGGGSQQSKQYAQISVHTSGNAFNTISMLVLVLICASIFY
jgi:hypothetical protein